MFNLRFILLLIKVNRILKKQNNKKDILVICNFDYIKIIFVLLIKVIAFYI